MLTPTRRVTTKWLPVIGRQPLCTDLFCILTFRMRRESKTTDTLRASAVEPSASKWKVSGIGRKLTLALGLSSNRGRRRSRGIAEVASTVRQSQYRQWQALSYLRKHKSHEVYNDHSSTRRLNCMPDSNFELKLTWSTCSLFHDEYTIVNTDRRQTHHPSPLDGTMVICQSYQSSVCRYTEFGR